MRYDVQAFSRPHGVLSRLGAPVARSYQLRFQRDPRAHARPGALASLAPGATAREACSTTPSPAQLDLGLRESKSLHVGRHASAPARVVDLDALAAARHAERLGAIGPALRREEDVEAGRPQPDVRVARALEVGLEDRELSARILCSEVEHLELVPRLLPQREARGLEPGLCESDQVRREVSEALRGVFLQCGDPPCLVGREVDTLDVATEREPRLHAGRQRASRELEIGDPRRRQRLRLSLRSLGPERRLRIGGDHLHHGLDQCWTFDSVCRALLLRCHGHLLRIMDHFSGVGGGSTSRRVNSSPMLRVFTNP
ncbi:MAG: DUF1990 family protein [Sandaracinaceae bacterium]|nr:DUF1990 family protein [Sandaracinaceae bacterium]